jgi:N-glycosylase/DNA lyase
MILTSQELDLLLDVIAAHMETLKSRSRFIKSPVSNTSLRIKRIADLLNEIQQERLSDYLRRGTRPWRRDNIGRIMDPDL